MSKFHLNKQNTDISPLPRTNTSKESHILKQQLRKKDEQINNLQVEMGQQVI